MKFKSYISLFVACAAAFSSCEKSAIDNFMVDDTVMLLNSGLVQGNVYLGLDDPYEIYVLKSGKGFQSANVSISVDEDVLTVYNETAKTPLSLLPADCYSITVGTLAMSNEDYQRPFEISWDRTRLAEVLAENPNVAIPLRLSVDTEGVNFNENKMTTVLQPMLSTPYVSLTTYGFTTGIMPTRQSSTEEDIYMTVSTNFIPKEDIDYSFSIDPSLIDTYNQEHNTAYKLLPEDAYRIDLDGWQIKKNMKSGRFKFTFVREALIPENGSSKFGDYILPLRLNSISSSNINPDKNVMLYVISVVASKLDKSKWSIVSCSSDIRTIEDWETVEGSNYVPDNLIDGTSNNYWRSIWSEPTDFPCEIVIDFGEDKDLYRVGIEAPASSNRKYYNSKSGSVEVASSPEGPWTSIADWTYPSKTASSYEFEVQPSTGRYMKFIIDESFDGTSKMAIGELNVWGE